MEVLRTSQVAERLRDHLAGTLTDEALDAWARSVAAREELRLEVTHRDLVEEILRRLAGGERDRETFEQWLSVLGTLQPQEEKPARWPEDAAGARWILAGGTREEQVNALVWCALDSGDEALALAAALEHVEDADENVRAIAVLCLGHIARVFGRIPLGIVEPVLKHAREDESWSVRGNAEDAFSDIDIYITREETPPVASVVDAHDMAGDDDEEAELLEKQLEEARGYLGAFTWCRRIRREMFGMGIGGGDLPSAYFVLDDSPNPREALETYCELMEDWIDAVERGRDLDDVFPVAAAATPAHAEMVRKRIEFIRTELLAE
jgi:hypothetical protein